jgi:hypothetical protein
MPRARITYKVWCKMCNRFHSRSAWNNFRYNKVICVKPLQLVVLALALLVRYSSHDYSMRQNTFWSCILIFMPLIFLIYTLRSDFESGKKVVLQTRIFWGVGEKWFCKLGFFSGSPTRKKSVFTETILCHPQNYFEECRLKGWLGFFEIIHKTFVEYTFMKLRV